MHLSETDTRAPFVIRPSVTLAIPYLGVLGIWFLWVLLTLTHPESGPLHLITWTQLVAISAGNAVLLVCLLLDGYGCRTSPPGLRRGHLLGIGLAVAAVVVVQVGIVFAYGPIQAA